MRDENSHQGEGLRTVLGWSRPETEGQISACQHGMSHLEKKKAAGINGRRLDILVYSTQYQFLNPVHNAVNKHVSHGSKKIEYFNHYCYLPWNRCYKSRFFLQLHLQVRSSNRS